MCFLFALPSSAQVGQFLRTVEKFHRFGYAVKINIYFLLFFWISLQYSLHSDCFGHFVQSFSCCPQTSLKIFSNSIILSLILFTVLTFLLFVGLTIISVQVAILCGRSRAERFGLFRSAQPFAMAFVVLP